MIAELTAFAICVEIPNSTAVLENSRAADLMSMYEILICFAGDISFIELPARRVVCRFNEAPVLGFACDMAEAIGRMRDGALSCDFHDFYGSFQVTFERDLSGTVVMKITGPENVGIRTSIATLRAAVKQVLEELPGIVCARVPALSKNPEFHEVMAIARRLVEE